MQVAVDFVKAGSRSVDLSPTCFGRRGVGVPLARNTRRWEFPFKETHLAVLLGDFEHLAGHHDDKDDEGDGKHAAGGEPRAVVAEGGVPAQAARHKPLVRACRAKSQQRHTL